LKSKRTKNASPELKKQDSSSLINSNNPAQQIAAPIPVVLKGLEIQIYTCYTKKYLLLDGPIGLALEQIQHGDINPDSRNTKLLHQATMSLSTIFFGTQHRNYRTRDHGYTLYGLALKQLNHALSEPRRCLDDDVLFSVVTFTLLEIFVPSGRENYMKHMIGLEKMMELRGPRLRCSKSSVRIFRGIFRMLLYAALKRRQASFLAGLEWKAFLLESCPVDELEEQHLFNLLADCTVLLAEHDNALATIKSDSINSTYDRDVVTRKALDLLDQLVLWKERWCNSSLHSKPEATVECLGCFKIQGHNLIGDQPLPRCITCESRARTLMLHNATFIYVLRTLSSLTSVESQTISNECSKSPNDPQRDTKNEYDAAEYATAMEIYHWLPLLLSQKPSQNVASSTANQLAVMTAWTSLGRFGTPEGRQMAELVKTRSGGVFAQGLWTK